VNVQDRRIGVGAGREAGMVKPTSYYNILPEDEPYHIDCGGRVTYNPSDMRYEWECARCHQKWKSETLKNMVLPDLQARFYLFPQPDSDTYVIVEDTDGFKTFTRTIKWSEAVAKKLKKIPDPTR